MGSIGPKYSVHVDFYHSNIWISNPSTKALIGLWLGNPQGDGERCDVLDVINMVFQKEIKKGFNLNMRGLIVFLVEAHPDVCSYEVAKQENSCPMWKESLEVLENFLVANGLPFPSGFLGVQKDPADQLRHVPCLGRVVVDSTRIWQDLCPALLVRAANRPAYMPL